MLVFLDITSSFFTHNPSSWLKCVRMCLFGTCGEHIQSLMSVQSVLPVCRTSWPDVGDHQGARLVPVLMDATCERSKKGFRLITRPETCIVFVSIQHKNDPNFCFRQVIHHSEGLIYFLYFGPNILAVFVVSVSSWNFFFSWKLNQQFLFLAVMGFPIFQPAPVIFRRQPWKRNKKINRWLPGEKGIN